MRMRSLTFAVLLAAPLLLAARQQDGETQGDKEGQAHLLAQVRQVIAYAKAYRANVPSLECDETMLSQRVIKGKVKWEVKIKATFRELRDETEPGGFKDDYTFLSVDGKRAKPHFKPPYFVYNVFANSLGIGDTPRPACFDYRFTPLDGGRTMQFNIDVRAGDGRPGPRDPSCAKIPDEYHKVMLIDTASGAVRHVERRISAAFADEKDEIPYVAIDYAPQKLGEDTFWLPVRFEASDADQQGRMIATYSNFHRYAGVTRVLP